MSFFVKASALAMLYFAVYRMFQVSFYLCFVYREALMKRPQPLIEVGLFYSEPVTHLVLAVLLMLLAERIASIIIPRDTPILPITVSAGDMALISIGIVSLWLMWESSGRLLEVVVRLCIKRDAGDLPRLAQFVCQLAIVAIVFAKRRPICKRLIDYQGPA